MFPRPALWRVRLGDAILVTSPSRRGGNLSKQNGSYIGHLSSTPADEEVIFGCNQKFQLMTEEELGSDPPIRKEDGITYINIKEK